MDESKFAEMCREGERIDQEVLPQDPERAKDDYLALLAGMRETGEIDTYVLSKIVLGLMLSLLRSGDYPTAHQIWTADAEESLFGLGIEMIEKGSMSVNDSILYMQIAAYLHSMSAGDRDQAAEAVNTNCGQIVKYCEEEQPHVLPAVLLNWRRHLEEVFEGPIPEAAQEDLVAMETRFPGRATADQGMYLFPPSAWVIDW